MKMIRSMLQCLIWSLVLVLAISAQKHTPAELEDDNNNLQRILEEYVVDTDRFPTLENKKTKKIDTRPMVGNTPLCEEDIRLVGQVGAGFDRWPLKLLESNGTTATLELASPWNASETDDFLYFQYYSNYNTLCDGFKSVSSGSGTQVTVECRKSKSIALVHVFAPVPDSDSDTKEIPQCCHAGSSERESSPPAVEYAFLVSCEGQCDKENDVRQRQRLLREPS